MKGLFIPDITTEMFRNGCLEGIEALMAEGELYDIEYNPKQPTIEPEPQWNNHTVACLLADLYGDTCACNYNDISEWLPEKCEVIDACPNPVGVACWEQFLTHREGKDGKQNQD